MEGASGRGTPPGQGTFLNMEPEKTVYDAYFWQRLLDYDFIQALGMLFQIYS